MGELHSVDDVKEKLEIVTFDDLTQNQLLNIGALLPEMDSETARQILDQLPDFSNNAKDALHNIQNSMDTAIKENSASNKQVLDMYNSTIDTLNEQLKKDNLSYKEKKAILHTLSNLLAAADKKDSENKEWLKTMLAVLSTTSIAILSIGLALVGTAKGSGKELPWKK